LLHVSRRKPLRAERLQIGYILGEITDLLERAAGDAVQMAMVAAPDLWSSMIDPAQFETAVLNLVTNARDAMPLGGTLTISGTNLRFSAGEAAVLDLEPGEYVSLVLTDTGIGMSPEVLDRVFEPFFTTKDAGEGSGLGLAQVHSFAKRSGGTITIESEPGAGTSVALYFPRCAPARAAAITPQRRPLAERTRLSARILLVEDDLRVLNQTRLALQEIGLQVISARDGEAAMQALRMRGDIQLLLSDVVLAGGISGVEVARGALALYPGLPVLLVSGHAEEVLEKFGAIDEFQLLAKPYKQAELLALLVQMLGPQALPATP
ncbi:MAG: response regulator, partial [Acetobacteraceae bacterium]